MSRDISYLLYKYDYEYFKSFISLLAKLNLPFPDQSSRMSHRNSISSNFLVGAWSNHLVTKLFRKIDQIILIQLAEKVHLNPVLVWPRRFSRILMKNMIFIKWFFKQNCCAYCYFDSETKTGLVVQKIFIQGRKIFCGEEGM